MNIRNYSLRRPDRLRTRAERGLAHSLAGSLSRIVRDDGNAPLHGAARAAALAISLRGRLGAPASAFCPMRIAIAVLGMTLACHTAHAQAVRVLHPQGSAHGFVDLKTLEGRRIAVGDLEQRIHGNTVSSRLILHFFDGSIDDETTVFSQRRVFRFLSDHHVQRGPSFPHPINTVIDAINGTVSSTDPAGAVTTHAMRMPEDLYNGMASTILMNRPALANETKIAIVIVSSKPRTIHLSMTPMGEVPFTLGGVPRKATNYRVHVELGGVAGAVAPLIGKEPPDYHVLIVSGEDPAFIREEGPLYEGGPIWRLQQISAEFTQ